MRILRKRSQLTWLGIAFLLFLTVAVFCESYKPLLSCLIDLPGWEAEEASGMDPDDWVMTTGAKQDLITATRDYEKGDKSLSAIIQVGPGIAAMYSDAEEGKFDAGGMNITLKKIKGFLTHIEHHQEESIDYCDIRVVLSSQEKSGALFMLTSEGITEEEALKIAQKFDWDLMRKKAESLEFFPFP